MYNHRMRGINLGHFSTRKVAQKWIWRCFFFMIENDPLGFVTMAVTSTNVQGFGGIVSDSIIS